MRRLAALATALGLVLLVLAGAAPARAQDSGEPLGIRQVDATDLEAVEVTFFYSGERAGRT